MRLVDLKIEDVAFGGKGVAREQGKAVLFLTPLRANWFPPKSSAKRSSSPKQIWLKLSRVRRIASRQSARISADAVAAHISISITNISLRLNGDRCATRSRGSAN